MILSDVMFWAFIDFSFSLLLFAIDMGVHLIIQSINSTKTNALLNFFLNSFLPCEKRKKNNDIKLTHP